MDEKSYQEFYDIEYRKLYGGIETPNEAFLLEQQTRGEYIYNLIANNTDFLKIEKPLVLEVGCGAGGILKYFKAKGCDIKGIDLGKEYVEYGRTFNLDLEVTRLETLKLHKTPDLILYSHVFEHILDLNKELSLLNKLSDQNTLLYVEVPGIKNIHNAYQCDFLSYLQNAHTYHFTLTTLSGILNKYGFDLIFGDEYIQAVFRKNEGCCNNGILNDFPLVLKYLKKINKCRVIAQITIFIKRIKNKLMLILKITITRLGLKNIFKIILRRS